MSAYRLKERDWRHRLRERNAQMRADRPKMTIAALAAKYRVSYHRAYEIVRDVDGPRASLPGRMTRLQADRKAKIAAAYFNGVTIRKLAQQYAVTFQRIHQIVQRESGYERVQEVQRERNAQMRADRPKMTIAALAAKYRVSYPRAYMIVRDLDGPGRRRLTLADRNAKIAARLPQWLDDPGTGAAIRPHSSESVTSCSTKALGLGEDRRRHSH